VAQLRPFIIRIRELGAELILVGNGSPAQAAAFRDEFRLAVPLYTDPTRRTYRALGFRRSFFSTVGWSAIKKIARAVHAGVSQRGLRGDAWQQGGCAIVCADGSVPFYHASQYSGDHPTPETILAALQHAVGGERLSRLPIVRH
jgi:hypothetical protein